MVSNPDHHWYLATDPRSDYGGELANHRCFCCVPFFEYRDSTSTTECASPDTGTWPKRGEGVGGSINVDPESRSSSQTAGSSGSSVLRDIARYLLSSVKIGYEEGLDPSGYNFTVGTDTSPDRDTSSEQDTGQCRCDSNRPSSDNRDSRRHTQHSEGHSQEVPANESGDVTVSPAVGSPGSAGITADPGHDVSSTTHSGGNAEDNSGSSAGVETNTINLSRSGLSNTETTASSGQLEWHDGTHRWSISGCTDGDPQVCVSTTSTLVRQVHNQPGQTGNEDANHPVTVDHNKAVWEWILVQHQKQRGEHHGV